MLRIIAGLEHATSGEVIFEGKLITQPNPKISMVFQLFGLLPWKTAQENVEVPLEVGHTQEGAIRVGEVVPEDGQPRGI